MSSYPSSGESPDLVRSPIPSDREEVVRTLEELVEELSVLPGGSYIEPRTLRDGALVAVDPRQVFEAFEARVSPVGRFALEPFRGVIHDLVAEGDHGLTEALVLTGRGILLTVEALRSGERDGSLVLSPEGLQTRLFQLSQRLLRECSLPSRLQQLREVLARARVELPQDSELSQMPPCFWVPGRDHVRSEWIRGLELPFQGVPPAEAVRWVGRQEGRSRIWRVPGDATLSEVQAKFRELGRFDRPLFALMPERRPWNFSLAAWLQGPGISLGYAGLSPTLGRRFPEAGEILEVERVLFRDRGIFVEAPDLPEASLCLVLTVPPRHPRRGYLRSLARWIEAGTRVPSLPGDSAGYLALGRGLDRPGGEEIWQRALWSLVKDQARARHLDPESILEKLLEAPKGSGLDPRSGEILRPEQISVGTPVGPLLERLGVAARHTRSFLRRWYGKDLLDAQGS